MSAEEFAELRKFVAPEFVFGPGAAMLAGQYAANLSTKKALVVSCRALEEIGCTGQVVDSLTREGVTCTMFSDVTPNPRHEEVMAGAEIYRHEGCDSIVAVGGGSPMDCAKAIGIVCTNDRHILEFEGVDNVERPGPPLICIPTTAGTAADISQFCIINDTNRKVKIAIVSKAVLPDVALIDPELTMTMDKNLTAYTGIDAMTHAIEAYVSNAASAVTDLNAIASIRLIKEHLAVAVAEPENLDARSGMMLASTYAGMAFSNAILGANHAMAHSLGGLLDLPHGLCNAILLEHVIDFNFDAVPERYKNIANALGADLGPDATDDEIHKSIIAEIQKVKRSVDVKTTLGDLGVSETDLPQLADNALADACMLTNPKQPTAYEVEQIFKRAF